MNISVIPRLTILLAALLQGIALWALDTVLENQWSLSQQPVALYICYTLTLALLTMLQLGLRRDNDQRMGIGLMLSGLMMALFAGYLGLQLLPAGSVYQDHIRFNFISIMTLLSFLALIYWQSWAAGDTSGYAALFRFAWRNVLILGLSALFTLIFWGLLQLCAELFQLIGIDFFNRLFDHSWFYYPVLAVVFGVGIMLFRSLESLLDTILRVLQIFSQWLLPLLLVIALLFLLALPFTGLQVLWDTGKGTALILSLLGLLLFFINAVYQHGGHVPYARWLHRLLYLGVLLLPIFSMIAAYGLYLRLQQYGFTVERGWALVTWAFLTAFCLGYAWLILRRGNAWTQGLGQINGVLGILLVITLMVLSSPWVDFRKISAHHQLTRFQQNHDFSNLDIWYLSYHLGRPGYLAIEQLKTEYADNEEALQQLNDGSYDNWQGDLSRPTRQQFAQSFSVYPENYPVPKELMDAIYQNVAAWYGPEQRHWYLLFVDLNHDHQPDPVLIEDQQQWGYAQLWSRTNGYWDYQAVNVDATDNWEDRSFADRLQMSPPKAVTPEWDNLRIGSVEVHITY